MWLRNPAWRRLGLPFVCAGVVFSSPIFVSSAFVLPALLSPASLSPAQPATEIGPDIRQEQEAETEKKKDKRASPALAVRWDEAQPGCTFSRGDDGKYRYGLRSEDLGITLAVDAREVQILRHRIEPIFGVFLTIRYRGARSLDESPQGITLQFMKHFKVAQTSLDPDDYTQKIQSDADAHDDETRRGVTKHPEKKQAQEARLQDYQKSVTELIEFLSRSSLRPAHLDPATPEVSGWVFFNTKSKWLGGWKSQEEFVLRIPLAGKVFEFPFKLPPEKGELLLQKRQ